jgi:branched-chain amino acid transport system permease protein
MALGLSVIFGVVRVVNFAHGEMMTLAMYLTLVLFSALGLDPLILLVPVAAVLFVFGYLLQLGIVNPFINRPEHSQFMLLVAVALILVNVQLIVFGPDAQGIRTAYSFDSFEVGPVIVDASKVYAAGAALVVAAALFAFFRFTLLGKAVRACADNYEGARVVGLNVKRLYALTFGLGAACVGAAGTMLMVVGHRAGVYPARVRHRHHRRPRLDARRAARRPADRRHRGPGRRAVHPFGEKHVRLRPAGARAALPPAGHPGQEDRVMRRLLEGVPRRGLAMLAALLVLLIVFPFFASGYLLAVGFLILYFAYVGQAWNIMMGFAGQLSLGHSLYVGVGAYAAAALYVHFGISPWIGLGAAIALCAAAGAVIGFLAFRFGVSGVYFAILTIAFAEFARIGFDHFTWVRGSSGLFLPVANYTQNDLWNLRGRPAMFYYVMLALTAGAFVLCHALLRSRLGYYWLAIRESPEAAQALGVNIFRYKMYAVILSAAMTSLAGVIFAFYYNNLFPEQIFHISRSIELILGPIIGGIGTLLGPLVGALLITGLAEGMRELMLQLGIDVPGVKQVFYGVCLLLVVMFLPDGVWPPLARKLKL